MGQPHSSERDARVSRCIVSYKQLCADVRHINQNCAPYFIHPQTKHRLHFQALTTLDNDALIHLFWKFKTNTVVCVASGPPPADDVDPNAPLADRELADSRVLTIRQFYHLYLYMCDNVHQIQLAIASGFLPQVGKRALPPALLRKGSSERVAELQRKATTTTSSTSSSSSSTSSSSLEHKSPRDSPKQPPQQPALQRGRSVEKKQQPPMPRQKSNETPSGEENDCSICLDQNVEVVLPCMHAFCMACILDWNFKHDTCPLCRAKSDAKSDETWVIAGNFAQDQELKELAQEVSVYPFDFAQRKPTFHDFVTNHCA